MGDKSKIEWTDATWNPVTGCTKVSSGCKFCYAEREFPRVYPGRAFTDVRMHPDRLEQPLRWKRPRKIFVDSMSDLFHKAISEVFLAQIWGVMEAAGWHSFQVLTKRPERLLDWVRSVSGAVSNIWLGVSVEDQETADERIPLLLQTPAVVRFVSYEPALGPVDLSHLRGNTFDALRGRDFECLEKDETPALDWVIAGGESGPQARPSHPDWFRSVRDQCRPASVPFFFKQWGEWAPHRHSDGRYCQDKSPCTKTDMEWVGRKRAGRLLDGREWNEFPKLKTDN